jgi:hypothetical protein
VVVEKPLGFPGESVRRLKRGFSVQGTEGVFSRCLNLAECCLTRCMQHCRKGS